MSGSRQYLHLAAGNARLQRKRALVRAVLAAAEDDGRARDPGLVIVAVALRMRLELMNDRRQVAVRIALGEHVSKELRHRRRAKCGAEIIEGVAPAVVDALLPVGRDAAMRELLAWVVA